MKRCHYVLSVIVGAALVALSLQIAHASTVESEDDVLWLDPQHTNISFVVLGNLHETHGRFTLRSGTIAINPRNGDATGEMVINAASENSGKELLDAIMKNAILEIGRYPEIVFIPQRVEGVRAASGDFYGRITGLMQMHGSIYTMGTEFHGHLEGDELTAECKFLVPYEQWGVESPNVLSSRQIINSTRGDNSNGTRLFSVFAYMLPLLREISPDLFAVSDVVEVTIETSGQVNWGHETRARQITLISPAATSNSRLDR
jgi:polyisoprenoid-binding protein YceI